MLNTIYSYSLFAILLAVLAVATGGGGGGGNPGHIEQGKLYK